MNKAELVAAIAAKTELSKKDSEKALKAFIDVVAEELKKGSNLYPVHYSKSDTSGEKPYEEFVTDMETTDMDRFASLGVITGKQIPDKRRIEKFFIDLNKAFKSETSKENIVKIMKEYLPNFEHIETGKSLDNKM